MRVPLRPLLRLIQKLRRHDEIQAMRHEIHHLRGEIQKYIFAEYRRKRLQGTHKGQPETKGN